MDEKEGNRTGGPGFKSGVREKTGGLRVPALASVVTAGTEGGAQFFALTSAGFAADTRGGHYDAIRMSRAASGCEGGISTLSVNSLPVSLCQRTFSSPGEPALL